MQKKFIVLALLALPLAGCVTSSPATRCAGVGAGAGAVVGAVSDNNVAQTALVGGLLGAVAADQGYCR